MSFKFTHNIAGSNPLVMRYYEGNIDFKVLAPYEQPNLIPTFIWATKY